MNKKIIAGALGTMMVMTAAVLPVYAAETPQTGDMNVKYSLTTQYMLSIPTDITLLPDGEKTVENIGLSMVNTEPGKKVQVKIKSGITNNNVELKRTGDETTKVVSKVTDKAGNNMANDSLVAEFTGTLSAPAPITPITTDTGVLKFSKIAASDGSTVKAGTYTGTIVFEGAVADIVPAP